METGMDTETFINEIADRLVAYINSKDKTERVNSSLSSRSLKRTLDVSMPIEGLGIETALDDLDLYIEHSVKTHRAEFMNPLWGGLSLPALAGEMVAAATNNSMYTFELSPFATIIEHTILNRLCEIVGFPDGFGTMTTGGSNGNMIGMLCAREHAIPGSTKTGFDGSKMVVFVSDEAHYSVLMAANVIGIGHQNVIKVRSDEDGRMLPSSLQEEIDFARKEGFVPFCVVATSGTTVRGAFDPLSEIADIAHENNLWFHVDAAWGGACMFSPMHRGLMDGVEKADSLCWDAHKLMGLPLICSTFLVKRPEVLRTLCRHADVAHYLFHNEAEDVDLGRYSLQCGRRNDALKLWLEWRVRGDAGWSAMVEQYMDYASHLEHLVNSNPSLELMSTRMWTNVCFRYSPQNTDMDLNELNVELRKRLIQEGMFMVSRSNIGDDVILRPVISNQNVTIQSIERFVESVLRLGDDIVRGLPSLG